MDEYISREAVIKIIDNSERPENDRMDSGYNEALNDIKQYLAEMPSAGVQPVKHGKWLARYEGDIYEFSECSECGNMASCETPYCA